MGGGTDGGPCPVSGAWILAGAGTGRSAEMQAKDCQRCPHRCGARRYVPDTIAHEAVHADLPHRALDCQSTARRLHLSWDRQRVATKQETVMTRLIPLGALIGLAIATQVQAQQAPPAQNTQAPTSQNSPTSIGPDPFRAHDANVSPRERAEEGAKSDATRDAATDDARSKAQGGRRAQGRCESNDGGRTASRRSNACSNTPPAGTGDEDPPPVANVGTVNN